MRPETRHRIRPETDPLRRVTTVENQFASLLDSLGEHM